jgi:hypothetical protein
MWFVTLDRPEGVTECIVPDTALRLHLVMGQAYRCVGVVRNRLGAVNLRVRSITGLPEKFM